MPEAPSSSDNVHLIELSQWQPYATVYREKANEYNCTFSVDC